jgi:hypothetical protein
MMETVQLAHPITEPARVADDVSMLGLVELMLKDRARLNDLLRDESRPADLIPRFLAVALAGFLVFGVAATMVLNASATWPAWVPAARWTDRTGPNLILAYTLGLVAAIGVCLPSFYFYGLLAGVKISMPQVTAHAMKSQAVTAVVLVGILPIYVALALGMIVFQVADEWQQLTISIGLALPFIAGLWGVRALYVGFLQLCETIAADRRAARACFLRRLTLAWAAVYTVVTPVMIYTLWKSFSG